MKIDGTITILLQTLALKKVKRQGWIDNNIPLENVESVADHSFGTAILALLIGREYFPELDLKKVLIYALIHDLGEIFTGDITPKENVSNEKKYELEKKAFQKLFNDFPQSKRYIDFWQQFEKAENPEARFVKQLDKLEMAMQAKIYEVNEKINLTNFFHSAKKLITDKRLKKILENL